MAPKRPRPFSGCSPRLAEEEVDFLDAVSHGNLACVESMLGLRDGDKAAIKALLQLKDSKDRTALEIATENEHYDIVFLIVDQYGHVLSLNEIHESLMLAISKGYLNITQVLLGHPCFDEKKNRAIQTLGRHETFYDRNYHSKFDRDVTPIMMAAMCNEVDILRLFLDRGDTVVKPHHPLCGCTTCLNRKEFDPLMHSLSIINAYRALCSEAYISLTSEDPILTAFLLSKELNQLCRTEKEFKMEYKELMKKCKTYASNLLDMCQNTEEVRTILKQKAISETEVIEQVKQRTGEKNDDEENALPRLEMAIKYQQKQFVAHPHCQHHLSTIWYQGLPSIRQMSIWKRIIFIPLFLPLLPFAVIIYIFYPKGKFGDFMRSPIVKFINQSGMYMAFLLLMFMESVTAGTFKRSTRMIEEVFLESNFCAPHMEQIRHLHDVHAHIREEMSYIEMILGLFVFGLIWQEIKQMWREGLHNYVSSIWNWIDLVMLNLLLSALTTVFMSTMLTEKAEKFFETEGNCKALVERDKEAMQQFYCLTGDRREWDNNDLNLIAEGLFAMANVLSFSRLSFILPASEFLGPLQISLGRMMGDIMRFAAMFTVVFLAFFCAMCNLYWYYPEDSSFGTLSNSFQTLMWALFGLGDTSDTYCPDSAPNCGHASTEAFGVLLYSSYMGIMVIVMLNMLIAMMSTSFDEINNDEDVEWKFSRSKLWLSYFEKGATLPVPFNLIPSPKSVINAFLWGSSKLMKRKSSKRIGAHRTISQSNLRKALRRSVTSHEDLMKKVVKRYLFKLQRSHDTDEVDEGELEEIKNDISSFRFDVLGILGKLTTRMESQTQLGGKCPRNFPTKPRQEDKLPPNGQILPTQEGSLPPQRDRLPTQGARAPPKGDKWPTEVRNKNAGNEEDLEKVADAINEKLNALSDMMATMQSQIIQMSGKPETETYAA